MKMILFVCTGNICRSPMAHAIFNHKIKEIDLDTEWGALSAGTLNQYAGTPVDPRVQQALKEIDIDFDYVSMALNDYYAYSFEYIIYMAQEHYLPCLRLASAGNVKEVVILTSRAAVPYYRDVSDPFRGPFRGFLELRELLVPIIDNLISTL